MGAEDYNDEPAHDVDYDEDGLGTFRSEGLFMNWHQTSASRQN
jgi:hypothetical protein